MDAGRIVFNLFSENGLQTVGGPRCHRNRVPPVGSGKARQWIKSKDGPTRVTGAEALIYFRSDANAAALKSLLDDAYSREVERHQDRVVKKERVYRVRAAAFTVLEAWGFKVPDVIIRESLPRIPTP